MLVPVSVSEWPLSMRALDSSPLPGPRTLTVKVPALSFFTSSLSPAAAAPIAAASTAAAAHAVIMCWCRMIGTIAISPRVRKIQNSKTKIPKQCAGKFRMRVRWRLRPATQAGDLDRPLRPGTWTGHLGPVHWQATWTGHFGRHLHPATCAGNASRTLARSRGGATRLAVVRVGDMVDSGKAADRVARHAGAAPGPCREREDGMRTRGNDGCREGRSAS